MQLISPDTHLDFLGKRKIAFAISGILLLISLGFLVTKGLNFGIDFTGGTLVEARFQKPPEISKIRKALSPAGYGSAIIQEFGSPEEILIRVQNANAKDSSAISNSVLSSALPWARMQPCFTTSHWLSAHFQLQARSFPCL